MTSPSDILTHAKRRNRVSGKSTEVLARDIVEAQNDLYEYHCAECASIGRHVRLKYMPETDRSLKFSHRDKISGEATGPEVMKNYRTPARFERWPGTADHKCDNDVRWQAFRSFAYAANATAIGAFEHIFPMLTPGMRLHDDDVARSGDLRKTFRPAGLGLGGVSSPKFFINLAEFSKKDPGLHFFQFFHDGLGLRRFDETYFESPIKLHDYLSLKDAWGRANSILVAYQMNPNTHPAALNDSGTHDGFIDRSMPKSLDGDRIKLFARSANNESYQAMTRVALRHGKFKDAPMLVMGEAYIHRDRPTQVEVEIFNPVQVCAWDDPYKFYLSQKAKGLNSVAQQALQTTLAL